MLPKDLLPKDKFDNTNLETIKNLNDDELATIIYDLFQWIQDMNWPIAAEVLSILIDRQNLVFPFISNVLSAEDGLIVNGKVSPDYMWQYWILELLVPHLKNEYQNLLKKDIERLALQPNINEDTAEIIDRAKECLEKCFAK